MQDRLQATEDAINRNDVGRINEIRQTIRDYLTATRNFIRTDFVAFLMMASYNGDLAFFQRLPNGQMPPIDEQSISFMLAVAARRGHIDIVNYLLESTDVEAFDGVWEHNLILREAVENDQVDIAARLLEIESLRNTIYEPDNNLAEILDTAHRRGQVDIVNTLVEVFQEAGALPPVEIQTSLNNPTRPQ